MLIKTLKKEFKLGKGSEVISDFQGYKISLLKSHCLLYGHPLYGIWQTVVLHLGLDFFSKSVNVSCALGPKFLMSTGHIRLAEFKR